VAVVDREQIRTVRRQAFGFRLPSLDMFAFRRGPNEESLDRITAELSGAHLNREGKWVMTTTENGSWVQTDSNELFSEPRHGSRLDVSKGVLGSFFCKVDRQPAIRCQRIG
jgi:hypothetical protein